MGSSNPARALSFAVLLSGLCIHAADLRLVDAAKSGNRDTVRALLKNRTPVNAADTDGTTPLAWAVRSDDLEMTRLLLSAGANPNTANQDGVTPLSLAATNRNAQIADALLKAGADANAKLPGGETMLMSAARTGSPDFVSLLLARGVNVNAREDSFGETALMWAATENHPEVVKLLLDHGAEINGRSNKLEYSKDRFGLEGVLTVLPHGSWTPLMYAARQGSSAAARVLAEAHADLNLTDPDGTTALILALFNSHFDTAALLIEKGADPNLADSTGMAALYTAVDVNTLGEIYGRPGRKVNDEHSGLDVIRMLLDHGANPNAQLKSATLYRAHTPGDPNLGTGATPLMRAAKNGDSAAMRLLLERGADPTLKQKNGVTALMLAAGLGRGLGVFANDYATEAEMVGGVKVLLDQHVDVNVANDRGQTAMHYAALCSDTIVKLLAENGAKLDAKDKQGRTPLDFASGSGGPGRAGGPPVVRPNTASLIRELLSKQ